MIADFKNRATMLLLFFFVSTQYTCMGEVDHSKQLRTLILFDDASLLHTHSDMINMLRTMNHDVRVQSLSSEPVFFIFNHRYFENILLMISNGDTATKFHNIIDDLTTFMDIGGNLMLSFDSNVPSEIRQLVNQLGYNVYSAGSAIYSNNRISLDMDAFTIDPKSGGLINATAIVDSKTLTTPLIYKGNALKQMPNNQWTIDVLTSSDDDLLYSASTKTMNPSINKGLAMVLVGAVQMRNNHRATIIPSIDFISNKYFNDIFTDEKLATTPTISSNKQFIKELLLWTFMEKSVLRVSNPSHKLLSSNKPKQQYTVMEQIEYGVVVEEKTSDGWKPFTHHKVNFALERMITHLRSPYNNKTNEGVYSIAFQIPDYIGLYKCTTEFDVMGYTKLEHYIQIVVRPRRHDEHPRYVVKCWPFYFTSFLMLAMTIVLSFVIINLKEDKQKTE